MNLYTRLVNGFDRLFPRPTQTDMEQRLVIEGQQTIEECQRVILDHKFTKHMAEAQIEAVIAWRNKRKQEENGND